MSELFRVLKPGGEAILQAPISKYNEEIFEDFLIILSEEKERYFGQRSMLEYMAEITKKDWRTQILK